MELTKLKRALRRLERSENRVARTNARCAVRSAVRSILNEMARDFPVIPKEATKRVTMRGLGREQRRAIRIKKLQRQGFEPIASFTTSQVTKLSDLAAAGVRVHKVGTVILIPTWTRHVPLGAVNQLRSLKRSARERAAFLSMVALGAVTP